MKIRFLLLGTSLSLIPCLTFAQCVATQDCETLGYTETSCNGGKGVKCPFGNKWACIGITAEQCSELGFTYTCTGTGEIGVGKDCSGKYQGCTCDSSYQYTCSGTGYSGGSGTACGGKYQSCTCASGYEWKNGTCQQQLNGAQGNLYYCNGTVVGVKASGMNFYVAIKNLGEFSWNDAKQQCTNYVFCNNTKGSFPSKNQLVTIYKNQSSLNNLLSSYGGETIYYGYYWSSTYSGSYDNYYAVEMSYGNIETKYAGGEMFARPILDSY